MKLFIGFICYEIEDDNVLYYTHTGEIKFVNNHVLIPIYHRYDKIIPNVLENFERCIVNNQILWINKNRNNIRTIDLDINSKINKNLDFEKLDPDTIPIIIFGNDSSLNNIEDFSIFDKFITAGVNRIYLKYETDFLFFLDNDIIEELRINEKELKETVVITTSYNNKKEQKYYFDENILKKSFKKHVHYDYFNYTIYSSVPNLIKILQEFIFPNKKLCFFIFGVSLTWVPESHFWKNKNEKIVISSNLSQHEYNERFNRILNSFKKLLKSNYKIYNCNKNSRLNEIIPYVSIEKIKNIYE